MTRLITRRQFNKTLLATGVASSALGWVGSTIGLDEPVQTIPEELFTLGVSSWCFHMPIWRGQMKPIEIPALVSVMGVEALEWTAKTFHDLKAGPESMYRVPQPAFFQALRRCTDDVGMRNRVMNVGGPFYLAGTDKKSRQKALDFFLQYVEPAQTLGCDILRAELYFDGARQPGWEQEAHNRAIEGVHALLEQTEGSGLTINVENHHGISSFPQWLADLARDINNPRFGLTVDTNNFRIDQDMPYKPDPSAIPRYVDRYEGLEVLMPYANWVSAKTYAFDGSGYELGLDYPRIIDIILKSGFRGCVSIEYEGEGEPIEGVRKSVEMFKRLREYFSQDSI